MSDWKHELQLHYKVNTIVNYTHMHVVLCLSLWFFYVICIYCGCLNWQHASVCVCEKARQSSAISPDVTHQWAAEFDCVRWPWGFETLQRRATDTWGHQFNRQTLFVCFSPFPLSVFAHAHKHISSNSSALSLFCIYLFVHARYMFCTVNHKQAFHVFQ